MSPRPAVREHLAGERLLGAVVVGDRGEARAVGVQAQRAERPALGREAPDESAVRCSACAALPPLPTASRRLRPRAGARPARGPSARGRRCGRRACPARRAGPAGAGPRTRSSRWARCRRRSGGGAPGGRRRRASPWRPGPSRRGAARGARPPGPGWRAGQGHRRGRARARQPLRVARRDVHPGDTVDDGVDHPADRRGDDRDSAGHRLQRHDAERLVPRRADDDVGRARQRGRLASARSARAESTQVGDAGRPAPRRQTLGLRVCQRLGA